MCYERQKLAGLDKTEVKPPITRLSRRCAAILRSLPQTGLLFPNLAKVQAKDRVNELRQRCQGLGIKFITLHSSLCEGGTRPETRLCPSFGRVK